MLLPKEGLRRSACVTLQAYITSVGDALSVTPSSPGLIARSKPASVIRMQDAEPMYKDATYSDGQSRSL